jgi:hypothetical protein
LDQHDGQDGQDGRRHDHATSGEAVHDRPP